MPHADEGRVDAERLDEGRLDEGRTGEGRSRRPVALVILDGYGLRDDGAGNAVEEADTPTMDRLFAERPWALIDAAGLAVGLPEGQMGNSEVGHLNIGAGRVVYQEITRIFKAIGDGSFFENPVLIDAVGGAVRDGRRVHFMGLVSDGGVHSHVEHLHALLELAERQGAEGDEVFVHAFLDGRDTPPRSGAGYLSGLRDEMERTGIGRIASVQGRYYAMDRDNRWERTERAWRALVLGDGVEATDPVEAVERSYDQDVTDEFVEPVVIHDGGSPLAVIEDGDAVVFFDFRPDRARQLTRAFTDEGFSRFDRSRRPDTRFVCLTEYDPTIDAPVAFEKDLPCCTLADAVSEAGLRQLHIAETEKYAHVTFFLNGGAEAPKEGEERILVPSPKVATYDMQPEMSAPEVARRLAEAIREDAADLYVVNFANCDMVGHTGDMDATVEAVEAVDAAVGEVLSALDEAGGCAFVTADHGNAERMIDEDGETPFTAHTVGPVPFIAVCDEVSAVREGGKLADVAPSVLDLLALDPPEDWTGASLIERA